LTQQTNGKASTKGQRCSLDVPGLGLIDGRTREAKLYGMTVADIASDLGGTDELSRAELELIRRAAGLSVLAALAESRLLSGDNIDISELVSVGNAQRRILATLGLQRRQKDVTPSLAEALAQVAARKREAA
jgi:hypothetical protein